MTGPITSVAEYLERNVPREKGETDEDFRNKRIAAKEQLLREHPGIPNQPEKPPHVPGTVPDGYDRPGTGSRRRRDHRR